MVGITQFSNLKIGNQYTYTVSKSGYDQIEGAFLLEQDTTSQAIQIQRSSCRFIANHPAVY